MTGGGAHRTFRARALGRAGERGSGTAARRSPASAAGFSLRRTCFCAAGRFYLLEGDYRVHLLFISGFN